MSVTPASPVVVVGRAQQLTATATYSDGTSVAAPSGVNWSSANAGVATVATTGVVTAVAPGSVSVTATLDGVAGQAAVSVTTLLQSLDRSPSLAGPDVNGNGVRDDIDGVITGFNLTTSQSRAATQLAAALQAAMLTTTDANTAYTNAVEIQKGVRCMANEIGSGYRNYSSQLQAFTFNTKGRVMAYIAFEHFIGGSVFPNVSGTVCK